MCGFPVKHKKRAPISKNRKQQASNEVALPNTCSAKDSKMRTQFDFLESKRVKWPVCILNHAYGVLTMKFLKLHRGD